MVGLVERIMARRQIDAMINRDPVIVILRRRGKLPTAAGGWTWGPEQLVDPQQVMLIPFKRRMTDFLVNTELGNVPDLPYVLVGRHDLDIQEGDRFGYQGDRFEVKTIDFKREVRVAAQVDYTAEEG